MKITKSDLKKIIKEELRLMRGGGEEHKPSDGYSQDITIKGYVFPNDDFMDIHVIDPIQGEIGFESFKLYQGALDFMPLFIEYLKDALELNLDEHVFKFALDDKSAGESKIYGSGGKAMAEFAHDIFAEG